MLNSGVQVSVNSTDYLQPLKRRKKNRHKEGYFNLYYQNNKQKYSLANRKHRLKKQANKSKKCLSSFQQTKTKQLLKLLVNHRSFVPVPPKLKHPIIKE
jgi:hypothetical protein